MSVTIKDVAKVAGVSPSTVSRVISDDKSISDKTKEKVRQVMAELKYYPNLNARSLVNQQSNIIGLVLPNDTDNFYQNPFFPTVLRGISEIASTTFYTLLLTTGNSNQERLNRVRNMVFGKQVDGLIFLYSRENDDIINFLLDIEFPFVVIGSPKNSLIYSVDNDNVAIARELTNYLIEQVTGSIAFVGGDTQQHFMQLRYQGYKEALRSSNYTLDYVYNDFEFLRSSGYYLAKELCQIRELDGVIIADQLVYRGFQDGWRESTDREIVIGTFKSYNSSNYPKEIGPYININAQLLGQKAINQLLKRINTSDDSVDSRVIVEGILIV